MVGAVIYVRVSTKEQTENVSLPTQLRTCEEYCRRQGYEVLERFHEEGESAKSTDRSQLQNLLAKVIQESSTVSTKRSSSSARSTSRRTTATLRNCARNSRSLGSTVTQASSKNSTWKASWRLQNAACRVRPTSGCRLPSTSDSGSNNCSFPKESRSTETGLLEPAQPHRPSATCGKSEPKMKVWWTRPGSNR